MTYKRTTGKFEFTVDYEGKRYTLYREVSGTKMGKKQTIYLTKNDYQVDQNRYDEVTVSMMESTAIQIGESLIRKHLLQLQDCLSSISRSSC